jgi:Fe-Mn family superoxide dismutase
MSEEIYRLPDLPYDYSALQPHIIGDIMELHHDKHHATYVKGANTAFDQLASSREKEEFSTIAQLERNLAFNLSGHVLHSIFWTNMSPDGGGEPTGELAEEIGRQFDGFERFKKQMTQAASTIQGSGWALASWEPVGRRIIIQQVHDHQGQHGQGTIPLLALDAWEHAYYLQYKNQKAQFFDVFWNVVNWDDVSRRLKEAM